MATKNAEQAKLNRLPRELYSKNKKTKTKTGKSTKWKICLLIKQKKTFILRALCWNKRTRSFNFPQTNHSNYYYCWNVHTLWISYISLIQIWIFQADESQWDWDPVWRMTEMLHHFFPTLRNLNRGKILPSIFMYFTYRWETSENSFGNWLNI